MRLDNGYVDVYCIFLSTFQSSFKFFKMCGRKFVTLMKIKHLAQCLIMYIIYNI